MRIFDKIKKMMETLKEDASKANSISNQINNLNKRDKDAVREKLRFEYKDFLDTMEKTPVDIHDANVQRIYNQACNFLALQTFAMVVTSSCGEDPVLIKEMKERVLKLFFGSIKHTLSRTLEINELLHDNKFSQDNIGSELIERFNKCNNDKVSKAVSIAEDLIKKSLQMDEVIDDDTKRF